MTAADTCIPGRSSGVWPETPSGMSVRPTIGAFTARRATALVIAAGCLAGCGGGARGDVRVVSAGFLQALGRHDDAAACESLSDQARAQLEDDEGKPCEQAIGGLGLQPSTVRRVQVFMTNAKADLGNGDSLFLSQGPDGWRLDAIGCKPEAGKPADRPYDCALEI
jgi:hypothetical protein